MGPGRYLEDLLDDVNIRSPNAIVAISLGVEEELLTRDVAPHCRQRDTPDHIDAPRAWPIGLTDGVACVVLSVLCYCTASPIVVVQPYVAFRSSG